MSTQPQKQAIRLELLQYLAELEMQKSKKWLFKLKNMAEETNSPELFTFYHSAASHVLALVKTIEQLTKEYDVRLAKASSFNLQKQTELDFANEQRNKLLEALKETRKNSEVYSEMSWNFYWNFNLLKHFVEDKNPQLWEEYLSKLKT